MGESMEKKRRVAYLNPTVDRRLRFFAVHKDRPVSDVIEEAVGAYLRDKVTIRGKPETVSFVSESDQS